MFTTSSSVFPRPSPGLLVVRLGAGRPQDGSELGSRSGSVLGLGLDLHFAVLVLVSQSTFCQHAVWVCVCVREREKRERKRIDAVFDLVPLDAG